MQCRKRAFLRTRVRACASGPARAHPRSGLVEYRAGHIRARRRSASSSQALDPAVRGCGARRHGRAESSCLCLSASQAGLSPALGLASFLCVVGQRDLHRRVAIVARPQGPTLEEPPGPAAREFLARVEDARDGCRWRCAAAAAVGFRRCWHERPPCGVVVVGARDQGGLAFLARLATLLCERHDGSERRRARRWRDGRRRWRCFCCCCCRRCCCCCLLLAFERKLHARRHHLPLAAFSCRRQCLWRTVTVLVAVLGLLSSTAAGPCITLHLLMALLDSSIFPAALLESAAPPHSGDSSECGQGRRRRRQVERNALRHGLREKNPGQHGGRMARSCEWPVAHVSACLERGFQLRVVDQSFKGRPSSLQIVHRFGPHWRCCCCCCCT